MPVIVVVIVCPCNKPSVKLQTLANVFVGDESTLDVKHGHEFPHFGLTNELMLRPFRGLFAAHNGLGIEKVGESARVDAGA